MDCPNKSASEQIELLRSKCSGTDTTAPVKVFHPYKMCFSEKEGIIRSGEGLPC